MKYDKAKAKAIEFAEKCQDIEALRRVTLSLTEAFFEAIEKLNELHND